MNINQFDIAALTVAMEAAGESYQGQLGVAYVICNRADEGGYSLTDVCLKPYQFSCWNNDAPTRMNIDQMPEKTMGSCFKAMLDAYYELVPDPTHGANHYLNLAVCNPPPSWYDPAKVTATIGSHTFLKLP